MSVARIPRRSRPVALLVLLGPALLGGCADEDRSCVLEHSGESTYLRCPDGTEARFPDPVEEVPRGRLQGRAVRFGIPDSSGIEVRLEGTGYEPAVTDPAGLWSFVDIIPGPHALRLEYAGYLPQSVPRVLVMPGGAESPDIELRVARLIIGPGQDRLILSPRKDTFLATSSQDQGAWELFDGKRFRGSQLVTGALGPVIYTADGAFVYYAEGSAPHRLIRWNVDSEGPQILDTEVTKWELAADQRTVAYSREAVEGADTVHELKVWDGIGARHVLVARGITFWKLFAGNLIVAQLVSGGADPVLIVWDIRAEAGAALGRSRQTVEDVEASPDGVSFLFQTVGEQRLLFDGHTGSVHPLDERQAVCERYRLDLPIDATCTSFSGDGEKVLLVDRDRLRLLQVSGALELDSRGIDDPPVALPVFSADGRRVLIQHLDRVSVYETSSGVLTHVHLPAGGTVARAAFGPGDRFVVFDAVDEGVTRLWTGEGDEVVTVAEEIGERIFAPDGSALAIVGESVWLSEMEQGVFARRIAQNGRYADTEPGDHLRFSPDGSQIAFLERACAGCPSGSLALLDRATGGSIEIADEASPGFVFTPAGDLVIIRKWLPDSRWGELSIRRAGAIQVLATRAAWGPRHRIEVSESGSRVLFHEMRGDGNVRLIFMDLDVGERIPVDDVEAAGARPLLTDVFLAYALSQGSRAGVYASKYPDVTPE